MTATVATANTVRTSSNVSLSRTAAEQTKTQQPQKSRPSFLTVLLRALSAMSV